MEVVEGCGECRRLADAYEGETMAWFRVEGQLRIAEYGHDENSASRIVVELNHITRRRSELRADMERHRMSYHIGGTQTHPLGMSA